MSLPCKSFGLVRKEVFPKGHFAVEPPKHKSKFYLNFNTARKNGESYEEEMTRKDVNIFIFYLIFKSSFSSSEIVI